MKYNEKVNVVNEKVSQLVKKDCTTKASVLEDIEVYAPSFSTNTSNSKSCALYNKQMQGNYGLCWAATIATIYNYLNGTCLTAKQVADKFNIGYNEGANIEGAYGMLTAYGVYYPVLMKNDVMSWEVLKTNIIIKKPIYVAAKAGKYDEIGHAITVYGFTTAAGRNYVMFWNSGNGSFSTMEYKSGGSTFSYSNKTFIWRSSISAT